MPVTVSRANTRLYQSRDGAWVRVVYDTGQLQNTGQKDADGKPVMEPVIVEKTITRASIEREAGVLLPKARIKAILEAELGRVVAAEIELTTVL